MLVGSWNVAMAWRPADVEPFNAQHVAAVLDNQASTWMLQEVRRDRLEATLSELEVRWGGRVYHHFAYNRRVPMDDPRSSHDFGAAIVSRYPVLNGARFDLSPVKGIPNICARAEIHPPRHPMFYAYSVHRGKGVADGGKSQLWEAYQFALNPVSDRKVIGADMNAEAPSLKDTFGTAWADVGGGVTYSNPHPSSKIDFIWHGKGFSCASRHVARTLASDHRPLIADLRYV